MFKWVDFGREKWCSRAINDYRANLMRNLFNWVKIDLWFVWNERRGWRVEGSTVKLAPLYTPSPLPFPPPPSLHLSQSKRAINMYLAIDLSSSFWGVVVVVVVGCVCFPANTTPESCDRLPLLRISPSLSTKLYLL